jgi:hypothetical protein
MAKVEYQIDLLDAETNANSTTYIDIPYLARQAVLIDTSKFVNPTFYFEAILKIPASGNTSYAQLVDQGTSDVTNSTPTPVAGSEVSEATSTAYVRKRSGAITLTSGNRYRVQIKNTTASTTGIIKAARIIVVDDITAGWTKGEEAVEIGNSETYAPATALVYQTLAGRPIYKYESNKRDATVSIYFEAVLYSGTANRTVYARLIEHANPDLSDTGTAVSGSEVSTTPATANIPVRLRSATITLTDGKYYAVQITHGTANKTVGITGAKIIIQQSGTITKTQLCKKTAISASSTGVSYARIMNQALYDIDNLPASLTIYYQPIIKVLSGYTVYSDLYDVTASASVSGSEQSTTSTDYIWLRSGSISLTDNNENDSRIKVTSGGGCFISSAWIVIDAVLVVPPVVVKKPIMKMDLGPHPRSRLQFKKSMKTFFG